MIRPSQIAIAFLSMIVTCMAWDPSGYTQATNWQSLFNEIDKRCRATLYRYDGTVPVYRVAPPLILQTNAIADGIVTGDVACATSVVFGVTNIWCWTNYKAAITNIISTNGHWSNDKAELFFLPSLKARSEIDAVLFSLASNYYAVGSHSSNSLIDRINHALEETSTPVFVWNYMGPEINTCQQCYDALETGGFVEPRKWEIRMTTHVSRLQYAGPVYALTNVGLPVWERPVETIISTNERLGYEVGKLDEYRQLLIETNVVWERIPGFARSITVTPFRTVLASIVFRENNLIIAGAKTNPSNNSQIIFSPEFRQSYIPDVVSGRMSIPTKAMQPSTWGLVGVATTRLHVIPPVPFEDGDWAEYYQTAWKDIQFSALWATGGMNAWSIDVTCTDIIGRSVWQSMEVFSNYGTAALFLHGSNSWASDVTELSYTNYVSPLNVWTTRYSYADYYEALAAAEAHSLSDTSFWCKAVDGSILTGLSIELLTEGTRYELTSDGAQSIFTPSITELSDRMLMATQSLVLTDASMLYMSELTYYDLFSANASYNNEPGDCPTIYGPGLFSVNSCRERTWTNGSHSEVYPFSGSNVPSTINADYWVSIDEYVPNTNSVERYWYGSSHGVWPISAHMWYYASVEGTLYVTWSRGECVPSYTTDTVSGYCSVFCGVYIDTPRRETEYVCEDSSGLAQPVVRVRHIQHVMPGWNRFVVSFSDAGILRPGQAPLEYRSTNNLLYTINTWSAKADKKINNIRAYFSPK